MVDAWLQPQPTTVPLPSSTNECNPAATTLLALVMLLGYVTPATVWLLWQRSLAPTARTVPLLIKKRLCLMPALIPTTCWMNGINTL